MPELWTIKQVCGLLKVHKATIYRWMKRGDFPKPAVKKYGTHRWNADDVKKVVASDSK